LLVFYPPPNHVDKMMPTRLGNILRAVEIYPYERYGIDAAVIWPRLRPLLKPEVMALLEDRKTTLAFMLSMSLLSALFSLIWCPVLAFSNRWDLFLLCALGWPLAWMCYQNALQSALAYSEQLRATFDLYRHNLLKALNRPVPTTLEEERKEWLRLTRFFQRNLPLLPAPPVTAHPQDHPFGQPDLPARAAGSRSTGRSSRRWLTTCKVAGPMAAASSLQRSRVKRRVAAFCGGR